MKQLTIEHLAPYLPYGLGIEILNYKKDYTGVQRSKINGFYFLGDHLYVTYEFGNTGKTQGEYKPYLRPLSQLTQEILREAGFNTHVDFCTHEREGLIKKALFPNKVPYAMMQWLFANHYDVISLIEQGLALPIKD